MGRYGPDDFLDGQRAARRATENYYGWIIISDASRIYRDKNNGPSTRGIGVFGGGECCASAHDDNGLPAESLN